MMPKPTTIPNPNTRRDKETNEFIQQPVPDALVLREDESGLTLPDPAIMTCKKCIAKDACPQYQDGNSCHLLQRVYSSIMDIVPGLMGDYKPSDNLLIKQLATLTVLIARADIYFALYDYFQYDPKRKRVEAQPLLQAYRGMQRDYAELCKELGLSPMARHKLKEAGGGPVLTIPSDEP